jgi:uncharacterized protein YjbI with pentapeptide repeats
MSPNPEPLPAIQPPKPGLAKVPRANGTEIETIIKNHELWLASNHAEGERAELSERDLRGINLDGRNLCGANLESANLDGATLRKAQLRHADFRRTRLNNANLEDADLKDVLGLETRQLGGANVSGASLPGELAGFSSVKLLSSAADRAVKTCLAILLACLYCWLAIGSTLDVQLIANSSNYELPFLSVPIPVIPFYVVAPVLILALSVQMQLSCQRVWEAAVALPAIFPDGSSLEDLVPEWLFGGLIRRSSPFLSQRINPLATLQSVISVISGWSVVPITAALFWLRFLPAHNKAITTLHSAILAAALAGAIGFYRLGMTTLREKFASERWKKLPLSSVAYISLATTLTFMFVGIADAAINGVRPWGASRDQLLYSLLSPRLSKKPAPSEHPTWAQYVVPALFTRAGFIPFANLMGSELSHKPADWKGDDTDDIKRVVGINLASRNLRYADLLGAFLVNAVLSGSDLTGADLTGADLRGAHIRHARLEDVEIRNAKLQGAWIIYSDLRGVYFFSNMKDINLAASDLTGAELVGLDLSNANFAQATLVNANLNGADLADSDFTGADLKDANLQYTNLRGANLEIALNVTAKQLRFTCIDSKTVLPYTLKKTEIFGPDANFARSEMANMCKSVDHLDELRKKHLP